MKLVKKLLRLLPIIYLIFVFLCIILSSNQQMFTKEFSLFFDNIDLTTGTWDDFFEFNYYILIPYDFRAWFESYLSSNYLLLTSLSILFYELYLSIAFIMFDLFNFILALANKFIVKGETL